MAACPLATHTLNCERHGCKVKKQGCLQIGCIQIRSECREMGTIQRRNGFQLNNQRLVHKQIKAMLPNFCPAKKYRDHRLPIKGNSL